MGHIDYVDNRMDVATGTIQIRGVFNNPEHVLISGLFARVRVPVGTQENALLVPGHAICTDQQGHYLLVVNDQNTVEYRPVQTGSLFQGMRVIKDGIDPEDRVIVNGIQKARPGIIVHPTDEPKTQPTQAGTELMSD
jgi:RND family efflux transporter MFP subunit